VKFAPLEVIIALAAAVFVGFARVLLTKRVLIAVAKRRCHHPNPKDRLILQSKFYESSYKFLHYVAVFIWECFLIRQTSWLTDTTQLWAKLPHAMNFSFYMFYMYQCGFYLYSLFAVLFLDVKRKDWPQLITHHVVTLYLIIYSWEWGFVRVGLVILFLLDCSDIFLEGAKTFHYMAYEALSVGNFVCLVITFFACRIVAYPLICLRTTLFEAESIVAAQGYTYGWWEYPLFNGLLVTLFILQIYWFWQLLRVLWTKVVQGKLEDHREDGPQSGTHED